MGEVNDEAMTLPACGRRDAVCFPRDLECMRSAMSSDGSMDI